MEITEISVAILSILTVAVLITWLTNKPDNKEILYTMGVPKRRASTSIPTAVEPVCKNKPVCTIRPSRKRMNECTEFIITGNEIFRERSKFTGKITFINRVSIETKEPTRIHGRYLASGGGYELVLMGRVNKPIKLGYILDLRYYMDEETAQEFIMYIYKHYQTKLGYQALIMNRK